MTERAEVAGPDESGRPSAYWFWSELPDRARMQRQLADFHAAGFRRIYIQARPSMPLSLYLSDAFLAAWREAAEIMAGLGIRAGLYDDYAWTSGQAGGRVVAGADHLRECHLFHASSQTQDGRISGITATLGASLGPAVRDWIHEGGTPVCADWQLVAAVMLDDSGLTDVTEHTRLVAGGPDGAGLRLDLKLPPGARWFFFASARIASSRVINYLLPEAGACFVEIGLEPFAKALAGLMPGTVDQLFFDQPAPVLYRWNEMTGNLRNSLLWSADLAAGIRERGPLAPQLAALLLDEDCPGLPDRAASRSFIYRLYADLIGQAFFAPLRGFCDRHGLALSGHEILPHVASFVLNGGFSSIDPRVALAADFFGTDRWRDVTAVDVNNTGPQLAPMLGQSIARASGRRDCLTELYLTATRCETRAAGQWEITPALLRATLIRLHCLGASQVILHALYAGEGNGRAEPLANLRYDFPPGYNLQPWWGVMRALSDEIATLAGFIRGADPVAQVALLYPYETALTEGPRGSYAPLFGHWCEALFELGHLPLIIDEAGLARISRTPGPQGAPHLYGSRIVALALPGVARFADPASAARAEALGLPLWRDAPDPVAIRAALAEAPQVGAVAGLRARVIGRDAEGWWRLVLFNESEAPIRARLTCGPAFCCEGDARVFLSRALSLDPHQLICLRLREADGPGLIGESADPPPPAHDRIPLASGWTLATTGAAVAVDVSRGWQVQGLAGYSGTGIYETEFTLDHATAALLELPGLACAARVLIDGREAGQVWHPPYRLALGQLLAGPHRLRLEIANTAANRFYAGTPWQGEIWPDASGLTAPPVLLIPVS